MLTAVIIFAVFGLCLLALECWLVRQLCVQQRRIQHRVDVLSERIADRSARPGERVGSVGAGAAAPAFDLVTLAGNRVSRDALLTSGKPALLIFTDPRCGPCYELLPDIGGWQRESGDRLTIVLISTGSMDTNRAMTAEYGIGAGSVLLQAEHEVADAYAITMAPAAVLIRPDGNRAGNTAYGVPAIRELAATLGLTMSMAPPETIRAIRIGETVPPIRRPDLDGRPVDLAAFRGQTTLLLFWNPGCLHCQGLLPEMQTWATQLEGPRLLVASRGPIALTKDAGLSAPVVLDEDRSLAAAFGVTGTPAAVVIDAQGVVVTEVVGGASHVRALASYLFMAAAAD